MVFFSWLIYLSDTFLVYFVVGQLNCTQYAGMICKILYVVLQQYEEDLRRQLLLAYLPNITRLNGGQVSEGEKEDAERACIRHYMDQSITLPQR